MKMKTVRCSLVFYCLCFLSLRLEGISNFGDSEKNLISNDDRRGVTKDELNHEAYKENVEETRKYGTYLSPSSSGGFSRPHYSSTGYDSYDGPRGPSFSSSGPSSIYEGTALSGEVYPQYSSGYGGVYGNHGPTSTGSGTYQGGSAGTQYGVGTYGMSNKILALKGLLAGIALLGAAAALTTNPVLLQLGVVKGRRRRRSIILDNAHPVNLFAESRQGKSNNR